MITNIPLHKPYDIPVSIPSMNLETQRPAFHGEFVHTLSGKKLQIQGFVHCPNQGIVRYSLPLEGNWDYVVYGSWSEQPIEQGCLHCVVNQETRYPVAVTPTKVRPLFTKNEKPYFMSMYECNWLFSLWMSDEQDAREFLATMKKNRFNSIAMNVYAHACAWTKEGTVGRRVPPPFFNWGGSNDTPDFKTTNPEFYKRFDELIEYMYELDMEAHLYFFVWNKGNSYPEKGSVEESDYISYIVHRYQAFPNVIWDYGKEAYLRIDKGHIHTMLKLIRKEDVYKRLLTIHDDKVVQYDESFDDLLDFYTMQIHHDYFSKTLREIEKVKKPVFTSEYTYESGKDLNDKTFMEAHSYEENMLASWELAIAGSPICFYYTFTSWDVIRTKDTPRGYDGFAFLCNYFESFDWWNYTAVPEGNRMVRTIIACAKHIDEPQFILLTDKRGRFGILVDFEKYTIEGEWVDIYTGERRPMEACDFSHQYNSEITFGLCPFGDRHGNMSFYLAKFELREKV